MDMNVDDPGRRAGRRLFETAYTRSPYRFTVIGYPDIFNELKPDDIRGYYREKYAPNNVFYVVAGDVKNDEVVAQIRAAYEKSRRGRCRRWFCPRNRSRPRRAKSSRKRRLNSAICISRGTSPKSAIPTCRRWTCWPCCSGSGRSSRLYQEVRERQGVVHHVDAWTYSPGNPGLFGMSAIADADKFADARGAMLAEIEKMKGGLVSPGELEKAVKQFISATLATRKTMEGQAQRSRRKLDCGQRPRIFPNASSPPSNWSRPRTSSAWPANISRRKTARFTRCCPTAARRRLQSRN